jgi:hypothetical protein
MEVCEPFKEVQTLRWTTINTRDPPIQFGENVSPGGSRETFPKWLKVAFAKASRSFFRTGPIRRKDLPDWFHDSLVNLAQVAQTEQ